MSEVKNIPEGWVETTLGEVLSFDNDRISVSELNIDNYISTENLLPDKQGITQSSILPNIPKVSKFEMGDVLFSNIRTYFKKVWFSDRIGGCSNDVIIFKPKDDTQIIKKFLYYFISSDLFIDFTVKSAKGTKMPRGDKNAMLLYNFNLPPLHEQQSIASILTSFDDKIELLQAQNKTLEEMAQTIFTEWFGKYSVDDELPEGWSVGKIGDLIEIRRGSSPRPIQDYISDSGYKWLKISDATATDSPYILEIKEHIIIDGLKNTTLKKAGDLVLSNSATPGMPKILAIDTCVHDGWMHFPSSKVSNEYLYLLFLSIRPLLVQQGSGSVFTNLKTDILREFDVIIASKEYYLDFDKLIKPIFKKIYNNALQIQSLKKNRDELLPRLMTGEIRVKM
ncbi:restriction endonuclease subunit S [Flavobacterium croceum]|uniref:restriction endonuclease subunit S n=1 Tax=Flavobacterium croceum TaxID=370975 RepID=UPI0024A8AC41|nr:restriction endonuclease subunit S [Flavobacterium croceum]